MKLILAQTQQTSPITPMQINAINVPSDTDGLTQGSTNLYFTLANLFTQANALTSIAAANAADKIILLDESETEIATLSVATLRNQIGIPDYSTTTIRKSIKN